MQAIPLSEENFEDAVQQAISACWGIIPSSNVVETERNGLTPISKTAATAIFHFSLIKTIRKNLQETVLFTVDDFTAVCAQFCPYACSDAKLLKKKIKQLSEGEAGDCCPARDNRDYFGKDNPEKTQCSFDYQ